MFEKNCDNDKGGAMKNSKFKTYTDKKPPLSKWNSPAG